MARPRFDVQHFVGCLDARAIPPVGPNNPYQLTGVRPVYAVPAAAGFPQTLRRYELFTRFLVHRVGRADSEIRLAWQKRPGKWVRVETYGPFAVHFRPGEPARDHAFRLLNVPLRGVGWYAFRLYPLGRSVAGTEYLHVVSQP